MVRLLHLNGPPGIGKSTLARRYADDHPGVLCCDIDLLRTLVGGWRDDFVASGAAIRPAALAFVTAYLGSGRDVVLRQLIPGLEESPRSHASGSGTMSSPGTRRYVGWSPTRAATTTWGSATTG